MSKYLLLAVALIATNNLKSFSSAAETVTPIRPESRGCLSFLSPRSRSQVLPSGSRDVSTGPVRVEVSPVAITRQSSPVDLSAGPVAKLQKNVWDMAAFAAWIESHDQGTPIVTPSPVRRK